MYILYLSIYLYVYICIYILYIGIYYIYLYMYIIYIYMYHLLTSVRLRTRQLCVMGHFWQVLYICICI